MSIPRLAQWLEDTDIGGFNFRSSQLKELDKAIETYGKSATQVNLFAITNALTNWERSRGPNAGESKRNYFGAITALKGELKAQGATFQQIQQNFSMEEKTALVFMHGERQKVLKNVFAGADVVFVGNQVNKSSIQSMVKQAIPSSTSNPLVEQVRTVIGNLKDQLSAMAEAFFEVALGQLGNLGQWLVGVISEVAASIAPYIGLIKDIKELLTGWVQVGKSVVNYCKVADRQYLISTGDPMAAFSALKVCMEHEAKELAKAATLSTTSFLLKTGGFAIDFGTISHVAVGIVKALAEFARQLIVLASEWRAIKALRKILTAGNLDMTVFKTYPLMGAYMLSCATLSDIIPVDNFGTPGWMNQTEKMRQDYNIVLSQAASLIQNSKFVVTGLPKMSPLKPKMGTTGNMLIGFMNAGTSLVSSLGY